MLCFFCAAPKIWNNLPLLIRKSHSIISWKTELKTQWHLFVQAFPHTYVSILHIAYSQNRAIPAIDIDIWDICWDAHFRSGRIPRCMACIRAMQLLYLDLAEDSKHSINIWYRYTEGRFYFSLVLHRFISLFYSARLLTPVIDQPMCAPSTHMHMHHTTDAEVTLPAHPGTPK